MSKNINSNLLKDILETNLPVKALCEKHDCCRTNIYYYIKKYNISRDRYLMTEEHKEKISLFHANVSGKNNPNYKHGESLLTYKCKNCEQIITYRASYCVSCHNSIKMKKLMENPSFKENCTNRLLNSRLNNLNEKKLRNKLIHKHHLDLNRRNNSLENILYLIGSDHAKFHRKAYEYLIKTNKLNSYMGYFLSTYNPKLYTKTEQASLNEILLSYSTITTKEV